MPPPPRMNKPNGTIKILFFLVNSKNDSEIEKKLSISHVEIDKSNTLIYNTFHFEQYSRHAIHLNIFR